MIRIHAPTISAEMIKLKASRNWPAMEFISNTMGQKRSPISARIDVPIAIALDCTDPNPATGIGLRNPFLIKASAQRRSRKGHSGTVSISAVTNASVLTVITSVLPVAGNAQAR